MFKNKILKNNKGFMLIEVIVTSTIVVTAMIALYTSFIRIYNNYRIKNSYYNLDTAYATKELVNSMINENLLNLLINNTFTTNNYGYILKKSVCDTNFSPSTCQNLKKLYNLENVILTKYNLTSLTNLKNTETTLNQTFYDYIDYLITYYDLTNTTDEYNYIILTETKDKDKYYYTNLRMR